MTLLRSGAPLLDDQHGLVVGHLEHFVPASGCEWDAVSGFPVGCVDVRGCDGLAVGGAELELHAGERRRARAA